MSGVSAEKSFVAKMLSAALLIPSTSLKFLSVGFWGCHTTMPGGFSSTFGLNAMVTTQ